jgi:hypothetical protein
MKIENDGQDGNFARYTKPIQCPEVAKNFTFLRLLFRHCTAQQISRSRVHLKLASTASGDSGDKQIADTVDTPALAPLNPLCPETMMG